MPDQLTDAAAGPDGMYSTDHPPTRGQWHAIATTALDLLGVASPQTRLDATVALTRLQLANQANPEPPVRVDRDPGVLSVSRLHLARRLVASVTDDHVRDTIDAEHSARHFRRELRLPRGASRPKPPACPACHRFVLSTSADCGCGWSPVFGWGS